MFLASYIASSATSVTIATAIFNICVHIIHPAAYDSSSFSQYYLENLDTDIFDLVYKTLQYV